MIADADLPLPPPPPEPPRLSPATVVAREKAYALLLRHLSPEQRREYEMRNSFVVAVGDRRYRIRNSWSGNIDRIDDQDRPLETLCLHFAQPLPVPDLMLAQKLLLESDEEMLRRIANVTERRVHA